MQDKNIFKIIIFSLVYNLEQYLQGRENGKQYFKI